MDAYRIALQALLDATVALKLDYSLILIIYISINPIQSPVHDLQPKQVFPIIAYLTLTFDLVTLTFGQLFCLININLICKYHKDPIIQNLVRLIFNNILHTHTHTHTYTHTHTHTHIKTVVKREGCFFSLILPSKPAFHATYAVSSPKPSWAFPLFFLSFFFFLQLQRSFNLPNLRWSSD